MTQERVMDRIRKVLSLAQRGEAGERAAAKRILHKLLAENGLLLEDVLAQEVEQEFVVRLSTANAYSLFAHVYCFVTGQDSIRRIKERNKVRFLATQAHGIEILSLFSVYQERLKATYDLAFTAFIHKNDLARALSEEEEREAKPLTPEEKAELLKLRNMMEGLDRVEIRKAVEA